jgi:hypothetical protein
MSLILFREAGDGHIVQQNVPIRFRIARGLANMPEVSCAK